MRTDVYQLGVVIYEMLTGQTPFLPGDPARVISAIQSEEIQPPRELNTEVSPQLDKIVMKAMSRKKEERFQFIIDFTNALKALEDI